MSVDKAKQRERAQQVALFRYQLICPALEPGLSTKQRGRIVRAIADRDHDGPFGDRVRYSRESLDRWIRRYRAGGFEALCPSLRQPGTRIDTQVFDLAAALKQENPGRTVAQISRILRSSTGWSPSETTLLRYFHRLDLMVPDGAGPAVFGRFGYLPPDADRRLTAALQGSDKRLRADALLLARATGVRIGELVDLELDCVHEVPGAGAWLKVALGKLDTERMVPLDPETVDLVDRIVENRSPGRPVRHPRTGRLVEFLFTHQGRRVSKDVLRDELTSAAQKAGLGQVTPHQLRHTFATALVNSGVSLQSLMAMLGHVSAEMSLRYGRLFDTTVRAEYERALTQAKTLLGPTPPPDAPRPRSLPLLPTESNWREAPEIKARLSGGYCVRAPAQGACPYANICEHCPSFHTDTSSRPVLAAQRADAALLAADAEHRGWTEEAARHHALVTRHDLLLGDTDTTQAG